MQARIFARRRRLFPPRPIRRTHLHEGKDERTDRGDGRNKIEEVSEIEMHVLFQEHSLNRLIVK